MTIEEADDIRDYIEKRIYESIKNVTNVIIEFDEDDHHLTWIVPPEDGKN